MNEENRLLVTNELVDFEKWNEWNEIDFKVRVAKKAHGTESTSWWFQTSSFFRVAEFSSHHEIGTNVNLVIQLKQRLETPSDYILK